jgi:hypothetical protein
MDRGLSLEHLKQVEVHIVEGEHHVRRQREIIARLERGGHDTALANELLDTLEMTLANHVTLRERLVDEWRQDEVDA